MKECCKTYLMEQFGDGDVVEEIYGEYVSSMKAKTAECADAVASLDWEALDRAAHAMKGNARAVGDLDVSEAAVALRSAAKLQDVPRATEIVADLKKKSAAL